AGAAVHAPREGRRARAPRRRGIAPARRGKGSDPIPSAVTRAAPLPQASVYAYCSCPSCSRRRRDREARDELTAPPVRHYDARMRRPLVTLAFCGALSAQPAVHTTTLPGLVAGAFGNTSLALPLGRTGGLIQYWFRGDNVPLAPLIIAIGARPARGA